MPTLRFVLGTSLLTTVAALGACSSKSGTTTTSVFASSAASTSTASGTSAGSGMGGASASTGASMGGSVNFTTGTTMVGTGGDAGSYLIYADTDTALFTLDPTSTSLTLTQVGNFDCIGAYGEAGAQSTAMTDLAVDKNQNIWGLSSYAVRQLTIQGTTVHCGNEIYVHVDDPNGTAQYPYIKFEALTFAPEGVIEVGREMLVAGDTAGQLWVIDPSTSPATITQHGAFGTVPADDGHGHTYMYPGGLWELSGDIVFLANNGSPVGFATVRDCPSPPDNSGCNQTDTLIEIDMDALGTAGTQSVTKAIRGQIIEDTKCGGNGSYGFGNLFGIASWNSNIYGFSRSGQLVQISNVDGTACLVKNYPSDLFSGAAVTTIAPVIAPPTQ